MTLKGFQKINKKINDFNYRIISKTENKTSNKKMYSTFLVTF